MAVITGRSVCGMEMLRLFLKGSSMTAPNVESPRPEIVSKKVADLKDHPWLDNVPFSNKAKEVGADMKVFGYRMENPVFVSSLTGLMLKGRCRHRQAKAHGIDEIPAIIVQCETAQDEIDVIARGVLASRQLTPAQYELVAYEYMKTLSGHLVTAKNSANGKKKGKKTSQSDRPTDRLAATAPEVVVLKQRGRDARAETAKLFKVGENSLKRFQVIEKHPEAKRYLELIREGRMQPKGVAQDIKRIGTDTDKKKREKTAAKLPPVEGWREGKPSVVLTENTIKFKLAITGNTTVSVVGKHVDPTGFLMVILDEWKDLKSAADAAAREGFAAIDLLVGDYSRESLPASKVRGTVRWGLLCRRESTELLGRVDRVSQAQTDDLMPPERMLTQIINATTVANEPVLVIDGRVGQYLAIKKLVRQPFVITPSREEFVKGRIEIGELKSDPHACLIAPEKLFVREPESQQSDEANEADEAATDKAAAGASTNVEVAMEAVANV